MQAANRTAPGPALGLALALCATACMNPDDPGNTPTGPARTPARAARRTPGCNRVCPSRRSALAPQTVPFYLAVGVNVALPR